ncbi:hypothetical protein HOK51_00315 [Candidatus Woesearchaeota archaeon]|jgi:hypothetical protein|nr:hypothetical protein [Candidatus Woesearchaeota archaeon]MBT6518256.1 hypothetical protein [Candidatus Woesearchaeota archaeon]MBT7368061.1 hypothetical protein [Candidatus Woesearchaeota archaeon]
MFEENLGIPEVPRIIKDIGFDFKWDKQKVWKLRVPVTEMNISELEWHFEIPFLRDNSGRKCIKPIDVIKNPGCDERQFCRVENADLKYSIDIMENKGRWLILDGLHRLMKSFILGKKKVKVRIIGRDKIPQILRGGD